MRNIYTEEELKRVLGKAGQRAKVGLVPTMGALHEGHLALAERSVAENDITVVSIFVNPAQFNDINDLARYPRTEEADMELLSTVAGEEDILFMPSESEIYPGGTRDMSGPPLCDLEGADRVMEGRFRPGHFNGVVRVVSRLFDIVLPDNAYFGEKDFQQLAVIRIMTKKMGYNTNIVGCATMRERDGLAMSSRNMLLEPNFRARGAVIFRTLNELVPILWEKGVDEAEGYFNERVAGEGFVPEYFEVVNESDLQPVKGGIPEVARGERYRICVALYAGNVRLIDNIPAHI